MRRPTAALLLSGVAALSMGAMPAAGADDLDEVLRVLAQRKHGEVSFVEQQFLALLKRPTESFGELIYDAPDRLEKRTLQPRAESLILVGDTVTLQRGAHSRVLDLRSYPQILPLVASIRATLAGDRATLARLFTLDYAGSFDRWTLTLIPLDARAGKTVAQIRIDGARDTLLKVDIKQPDGDRSLMTLRPHPTP